MRKPDTIIVDGRAYSWRRLVELRRQQIERWKIARAEQPALFPLREDSRPRCERTADGRYREPSLLEAIREAGG